jgi:hypothetical protein
VRRRSDPLFAIIGPLPGPLRPTEARARAHIALRPGLTVDELQHTLGVGRARIWQLIERLEWLRVVERAGDAPRRIGKSRRPVSRAEWRAAVGGRHQAIETILVLEQLACGEMWAAELARRVGCPHHQAARVLRRLEADGYVERLPPAGGRTPYRLTEQGRLFGRDLFRAPHETLAT